MKEIRSYWKKLARVYCGCGDEEEYMDFSLMKAYEDDVDREEFSSDLFVNVVSKDRTFWFRFKEALKYVFKNEVELGIIIERNQVKELMDTINDYLDNYEQIHTCGCLLHPKSKEPSDTSKGIMKYGKISKLDKESKE